MREPTNDELVAFMCNIQPELDERTAARLLSLDTSVREWIALYWTQQRTVASSLLDLHIELEVAA